MGALLGSGGALTLAALLNLGASIGPSVIPPQVAPDAQLTPALAQRIRLPELARGEVRVDALSARVELHGLTSPQAALNRLKANRSALCPNAKLEGKVVVLTCVTRRITASVGTFNGQTQLDLRATRGVPWAQRSPLVGFSPADFGEGGPCPGTTLAGRGECLFASGEKEAAISELERAAQQTSSPLAHLRLGDLAWDAGDANRALGHWAKTGRSGIASRLARIRECELNGACIGPFDLSTSFELVGLPEPVLRDVRARLLRLTVFSDRLEHALPQMTWTDDGTCSVAGPLCDSVLLQTLQSKEAPLRLAALNVYLQRPNPTDAVVRLSLARAAADASADLGAPLAGAQLLTSVMDDVPAAELDAHLLLTARLFEKAGDRVRAGVVRDFAKARPGVRPSAEWRNVGRGQARAKARQPASQSSGGGSDDGSMISPIDPKSVDTAAVQDDLAATRALLERAGNLTPR